MTQDDFFEKLDDFDFDSFGKDDNFNNSDVYQVIQFFANKIYNDLENKTCESCKYAEDSDTGYEYYCTKHNEYENSYMSCNKWLQK